MEDNRTLADVDYVCIQRVECFNISGLRNQESCKNSSAISSLRYIHCDSPLSWAKHPIYLRHQSGGNEGCYFSGGACYGQPVREISRYTLLSPYSIRSVFFPERFIIIGPRVYYSMAKDGLFFKAAATI